MNDAGVKTVTSSITVTLSCIDITTISTAFNSGETVPAVIPYTTDGHIYKIFIGIPGGSKTVALNDVTTFSTDIATCSATGIDLVTSSAGDTAYSGSVFSESNFVLTIDTTSSFYGSLYLKTLSYKPSVSVVDKVFVTVCGDQAITNIDTSNAVFSITRQQAETTTWETFSLANVFKTESSTLPENECPITEYNVCTTIDCSVKYDENFGFRFANSSGVVSLEINTNEVYSPQRTLYLQVVSFSV